jgi:hypothetical protein
LRADVEGVRLVVAHAHAHNDDFVAHAVDFQQEFHAALAVLVSEGIAAIVSVPFCRERWRLSFLGLDFDAMVFTETDKSRSN